MGIQVKHQKWKNNKVELAGTQEKRMDNHSLVHYQEKPGATYQVKQPKDKKSYSVKFIG